MADSDIELCRPSDFEKDIGNKAGNSISALHHESIGSVELEETIGDWKVDGVSLNENEDCNQSMYRYLTFQTDLPSPDLASLSQSIRDTLPAPPHLSSYESPLGWSYARKSVTIWLSCAVTCFTAFTAGAYSPGADQMRREWNVGLVPILAGITTFTTGFAAAPMVLAPFSELNGRKPVFVATGILFVICQLCCGLTRSYPGMLVSRFFVGVGGSTFSTMVGGVVSDIYSSADRNTPMALFSGAALFGTGLGPLVCGFIAQNLNWRWMFYLQTIVDAVLILAVFIFFNETRGSVLLSRKARALNSWYQSIEEAGCQGMVIRKNGSGAYETQRIRWKVAADDQRSSLMQMIRISVSRPFHLLFTEPILFSFSLWVSFSWAVLYLTLAAVPLVFGKVYHLDIQGRSIVFVSICIGAIIFTPLTIYQEKLAKKYHWFSSHHENVPESRLRFACVQSFLLPIGLFLFGWTARPSIHPIVPSLGLAMATMGIFSIYLATFNYLADVYGIYASSALAAQSFCRNIAGGILPLVTGAMFSHLGTGPSSSLLGAIGVLLGAVPWVLLIWGDRIRGWSPFAVSGELT